MVSVKSLKFFPLCCFGQNHGKKCLVTFQIENKNALTPGVCLACMEIRLRNEEAINSTQNRIYSLKVFQLLPTSATSGILQDIYFLFVSELIQYACQRRPEIRVRSQAIRVYQYTKIQGSRFQRNYIIARNQKSDLHGTSFLSSPK